MSFDFNTSTFGFRNLITAILPSVKIVLANFLCFVSNFSILKNSYQYTNLLSLKSSGRGSFVKYPIISFRQLLHISIVERVNEFLVGNKLNVLICLELGYCSNVFSIL
jgi:hypothetical protein